MSEEFQHIKVSLLDYTGKGQKSPALYAARLLAYIKNTRLEMNAGAFERLMQCRPEDKAWPDERTLMEEIAYIANTIRSSWEFVDYTFQIEGVSRAFTHQFVRTRHGSYAQQSQRSVDVSGFETYKPENVRSNPTANHTWNGTMEVIDQSYKLMIEEGVSAQDARGVLPTNIHTNICAKFNLRTMADLIAKRQNLRAQGEYGYVAGQFERLMREVHPWTDNFIDPDRSATPALDEILKASLGTDSPVDRPLVNDALKELDKLKGVWG